MFNYSLLDPRFGKLEIAAENNDKVFTNGKVLGIEVTIPALAQRCDLGNIDPQHSDGADIAAIEAALDWEIPVEGATLVTVRADLDAIGAMVVLALRAEGVIIYPEAMSRIQKVAEADKANRGPWPGRRELPNRQSMWPEGDTTQSLAAIASSVSDFKRPITDRVAWMRQWLLNGTDPEGYRERVEKERLEMIEAIENDEITVLAGADSKVAMVLSGHRAATGLGYNIAPVVVAVNPDFRFQGGDPHTKYTVAQYQAGYADLNAVKADLIALEEGWGGSPTIIGSPQGVSSNLHYLRVAAVVAKYIK